ncbi:PIG-L family deacetylase [Echinicola salinicaeni]|uniref:PIG-L family deacetylase n=1 Tax=Echinicola salinicaeni TaxID=2762757 RepID=UPI0016465DE4|nr:PIG-L family deacetylase [Echinicola salinicaeni]
MKLKTRLLFSLILISIFGQAAAEKITPQPSSYIFHQLLRLNETKRVLYIAAHPDDENTRLIAYLGNKEHVQVGYLSLTRGDGGQNLIGKELGVELGMIRTQELLKARKTDGGQQFFSRAIDFGYSKNPSETLNNWDKEELLSDVVWVIRNYQPDIIINRFNTIPGTTHGHHTTSAILSTEAFKAAADPNVFPKQLDKVDTWETKRVFWNAYNWGGPYEPSKDAIYHSFPVGEYNDLLGTSYAQIAANSRTMHKSQGFGSTASIGQIEDIIELVDGEKFQNDPFEGVENRWNTIKDGKEIQLALDKAISNFDFVHLDNNLANLLKVKALLYQVKSKEKWIKEKKALIDEIVVNTLGLKMELLADKQEAYVGEKVNTTFIFNNPSSIPVEVNKIDVQDGNHDLNKTVSNNEVLRERMQLSFVTSNNVSQPYWIEKEPKGKLYNVTDQCKIGMAFNKPTILAKVSFNIDGQQFQLDVPLKYKYNDPVDGEINQPFVLIPAIQLSIEQDQVYAIAGKPAIFTISVKFKDKLVPGSLELLGLSQSAYKIISEDKNQNDKTITYQISINGDAKIGKTSITAQYKTNGGKTYDQGVRHISYKHIPELTYFPKAKFDLIKLDLKISDQKIAYIPGAGDDVPQVLQNLGYSVSILESGSFDEARLSGFSTVIIGIRAFNVNEQLVNQFDELMKYVENGGNLIVQYNTTASLMTDQLGPYPFDITRKRVAVENSPVMVDFKAHSVLQGPNPISMEDFEGWVQERGLYFPDNWDKQYVTPLTMNDPGESASKGSLLLAKYGKGTYTYSGISWFRLLPAGVPGAIKLFVNLIEQGNE